MRRDSLYLQVTNAATPRQTIRPIPVDRVVTITRQQRAMVEGREFSPLRTAGLILGVALLLTTAAVGIALATFDTAG